MKILKIRILNESSKWRIPKRTETPQFASIYDNFRSPHGMCTHFGWTLRQSPSGTRSREAFHTFSGVRITFKVTGSRDPSKRGTRDPPCFGGHSIWQIILNFKENPASRYFATAPRPKNRKFDHKITTWVSSKRKTPAHRTEPTKPLRTSPNTRWARMHWL